MGNRSPDYGRRWLFVAVEAERKSAPVWRSVL